MNNDSFIREKWGDTVGLVVLFLGVGLVLLAPFYKASPDVISVSATGQSLILAGATMLKLRHVPKNGDQNAQAKLSSGAPSAASPNTGG